ncbi:MAG TPA: cupin domain-containing protein [Cyclobacteriaceae bacterium]|nr:cupin domain-containing protein [Cyclobacteriaceae bacterium]
MRNAPMEQSEIDRSVVYVLSSILEYVPGSVVTRVVVQRPTGSILAIASDTGEGIGEKIYQFESFVQVVDGEVEVKIGQKVHPLWKGQAIMVPAHYRHTFKSATRFKLISTIIKSGYEEVV